MVVPPPELGDKQKNLVFRVNIFLPWLSLFKNQLEGSFTNINIIFSKDRIPRWMSLVLVGYSRIF